MPRVIVANLDCEGDYARELAASPARLPPLPLPVRRMIASAGALLCGFARPGDVVWTPEPIDPGRIQLAQARQARFVSGDLTALATTLAPSRLDDFNEILAWGETLAVASLRRDAPAFLPSGASGRSDAVPSAGCPDVALGHEVGLAEGSLGQLLWHFHPEPAIARQANDRRYSHALAEKLGLALPGSTVLASLAQLERHLAHDDHAAGHRQTWVLKAPQSAAARQRVRRRGAELDLATRTRVTRLFAAHGELVFEPWVDRVCDFGATGIILARDRFILFPPHRLSNDPAGVFRAIALAPDPALSLPDDAGDRAAGFITVATTVATASATARQVAEQLAADGYRGPFGIDGFVYRDPAGAFRIHPLCEINARLSFGFLARVLAEPYPDATVELHLGSGPIPHPSGHAGPAVVPLLEPGPDEPTAAWLVVTAPHHEPGDDQRGLP